MSITVTLHDKELLLSAIADVRKDNTNTNWVIITHKDENLNILEVRQSQLQLLLKYLYLYLYIHSYNSNLNQTASLDSYLFIFTSWKQAELTDTKVLFHG